MCLVASEKKELQELQTADFFRDNHILEERYKALLDINHDCAQIFESLTHSLSVSGLNDLRGDTFNEWLFDTGLYNLRTALKDIDGRTLTMLNVSDVMEYGVTFNEAAVLLMSGYIAHNKLSNESPFPPPHGSVLAWDPLQTASWIATLDDQYDCLVEAGWYGPALCSLSPARVIEASDGELEAADAVKFIELVRQMRIEMDGDKAAWVSKWSGTTPIDNQA